MHEDRPRRLSASAKSLWLMRGAAATMLYRAYRRWPRHSLRHRVALVTGGSRGLGFAIARELLREGARVAICARSRDDVDRAIDRLSPLGTVTGATCDVSDSAAVGRWVAQVKRELGPIDVLVNNAGRMTVGPLEHMTREDFDTAMAVHYGGTLNTILAVLADMRRRGRGHIANVASIGGVVPIPHMAPYVASKFAVVGLSRALRGELGREGIRVTTICPGPMRTGSPFRASFKGRHRKEFFWFAATDALPFVSTGAVRAARRIVNAIRSGEKEITIGLPSQVLRWLEGNAPALLGDLIALGERGFLPAPSADGRESHSGFRSQEHLEGTWLLRRTRRAASRLQPRDGRESRSRFDRNP